MSFIKSLFCGDIAEEVVFPYPELSDNERDALNIRLHQFRKFAKRYIDPAKIDQEQRIVPEIFRGLRKLGFFGISIPHEYGGLGLPTMAYARMMQELASIDASIALTLSVHTSMGSKGITLFGTEAQKQRYLPKLASGEWLAAFALTEASAGSDIAAIHTRAELDTESQNYILNGSKTWVTNGSFAEIFITFARTSSSDERTKAKLTALLVERAHGGITHGSSEATLGVRGCSTTSVSFEETKVPVGNVLNEVSYGFKVAMDVLNHEYLSLGARCVGQCKSLISMTLERVSERKAFGRTIGQFGLMKDKIARMMIHTFALESTIYLTAGMVDAETQDFALESYICKIFGSETLWFIVNETLQIAAGIGYMREYPYERMLRDARINLIFGGTNEILRCYLALAGMQGPGKELTAVARTAQSTIKNLSLLPGFALRKARSVLGHERIQNIHSTLSKEASLFEEYTQELAQNVEQTLRKHGKDITEMQFTQKRIADLAIDLYVLMACLSRTTHAIRKKGEEGARREIELTKGFAAQAAERMKFVVQACDKNDDELLKNIATRAYTDGTYPFDIA